MLDKNEACEAYKDATRRAELKAKEDAEQAAEAAEEAKGIGSRKWKSVSSMIKYCYSQTYPFSLSCYFFHFGNS